MKILALEHELAGTNAVYDQQHEVAEARKVWELARAELIRESYFRADRNEAVLVLECGSVFNAEQALSTLPFVQHRLIAFELIPLKAYRGFERLFVKG